MSLSPPDGPKGAEGAPAAVSASGAGRWADRAAGAILSARIWVILLSALAVAVLGAGLQYAGTSGNARVFFGKNNPQMIALRDLEATYNNVNSVMFVVSARQGDLFTRAHLRAIAAMTEEAWQTPRALRIDSIANFNTLSSEGDTITAGRLYDPAEPMPPDRLAGIREATLGEPEIIRRLISPDGRVAGILVLVAMSGDDIGPETPALIAASARAQLGDWAARYPGLELRLTGGIIADRSFAEAGRQDQRTLFPLAGLLLVTALWAALRAPLAVGAMLAVIGAAVAAGLGTALWLGTTLNAATAASPIAIMVVALASAVHIVIGAAHAAAQGAPAALAMRRSLALNIGPVTATALTTVIGFLSLNFSDSPPLRQMGNIIALGTVFAWVFCLTLLPALFSYLPPVRPRGLWLGGRALGAAARLAARRNGAVLLAGVLILPLAVWGASRIVADDDYIRYFDERYPFRVDTEYTERHLTGLNVVHFSLPAGEAGVYDPAFLARLDRFAAWLEARPEVVFVDSLSTLIKRLNQAVEGGDPARYVIGESREKNAQNLLLYELSLPAGHDLNALIDITRTRTKLSAVVRDVSSREILALADAAQDWLARESPEIAAPATGLSVAFASVSARNIAGMVTGTVAALLVVSAVMFALFRDLRIGAVSLVPNMVPGLVAFGIWGFAVGQINLSATVVTAMTFGIIVDDTIHLTLRYLRARRLLGMSPEQAAQHSLSTAGFAIGLTTLVMAAGFAVLLASGFQLTAFLGGLSMLVILVALVADLLLLPALLMRADRLR